MSHLTCRIYTVLSVGNKDDITALIDKQWEKNDDIIEPLTPCSIFPMRVPRTLSNGTAAMSIHETLAALPHR